MLRYAGVTERVVEVPWMLAHVGEARHVLDVGSADATYLSELATRAKATLTAIDTRHFNPNDSRVTTLVCNVAVMPFEWSSRFDLVTCVSVLDHVGLSAYGMREQIGLLGRAVAEMARVLVIGGRLLVTVPFGKNYTTDHPGGAQRIFDYESLAELFAGQFRIDSEAYWRLTIGDVDKYERAEDYVHCTREEAADAEYQTYRAGAVVGLELTRTV